jgi:hypothetical protein
MIIELGKVTEETQLIDPGSPFVDHDFYSRF